MNEIKFCANFFRNKKHTTVVIENARIYKTNCPYSNLSFTRISRICSVWQSSYITDEPNKSEQKHPLHAASYNHETRFRETSNW